jgi:GNAT superfamily N-acetyltransferase
MEDRMTVRELAPSDKPSILALALESWSDAPFRDETPNAERIEASADWFIGSADAKGWLLVDGETIRGVLGVLFTNHLFTGRRIGIQWWWWVQPSARNGSGLLLLREAEKWAKEHGATALQLLAPSPAFRSLCERLDYNPVEMMYQKELV